MGTLLADMGQATPADATTVRSYLSEENLDHAAQIPLAQRRAADEVMTYFENGSVMREYPGNRTKRLAPIASFRAEDFPIKQ